MGVGEVGMNSTACTALLDEVQWFQPSSACLLSLLAVVDLMVVLGNCLVIAAVYMSSKLRSVTNLFIVSLAVADLMVGLAVLPFSAVREVFKVWIFGDVWCSMWLALDVWMCTASILNLCAISLDRYVAVTRPVTYPSIMSTGRAKILIATVWVLSFIICFPPLVDWRDKQETAVVEGPGRPLTPGGATVVSAPIDEIVEMDEPPCPWLCELRTNNAGYVIYSALGSFYVPMVVMLFFYWRIYRAAVQTTRAINQGFRTTKGTTKGGIGSRFDEQRLTLRIHRGRGSVMQGSAGSNSTTTTNSAANSVTNSPGGYNNKSPDRRGSRKEQRRHERIKISVSYPSSDQISANNNSPPPSSPKSSISSTSPTSTGALYAVHYTGTEPTSVYSKENCHLRVDSVNSHRRGRRSNSDSQTEKRTRLLGKSISVPIPKDLSPSPTYEESKPKLISRMGKRNIKAQVKRFRMETKAAKTLGIIVGGFILCWFPFFTVYLILGLGITRYVHPVVFSVLFWLGYCNSAINPCIYALFSKDFRFAFKRIICRCLCSHETSRRHSSRYARRGSDGSHVGLRRGDHRSASLDNNELVSHHNNHIHHSDSDPNNEAGSESR